MYNVKSMKAEEFISDEEIKETLAYADANKDNLELIDQIIEKAKLVLMDRNGMTEPEAFRYIQKVSMDTGRKSVETAEMILITNDG